MMLYTFYLPNSALIVQKSGLKHRSSIHPSFYLLFSSHRGIGQVIAIV